jgi:hypothetical protein
MMGTIRKFAYGAIGDKNSSLEIEKHPGIVVDQFCAKLEERLCTLTCPFFSLDQEKSEIYLCDDVVLKFDSLVVVAPDRY